MARRETLENSSRVYWRTKTEKRDAEKAASKAGMSLSTWLRSLAVREMEQGKAPSLTA